MILAPQVPTQEVLGSVRYLFGLQLCAWLQHTPGCTSLHHKAGPDGQHSEPPTLPNLQFLLARDLTLCCNSWMVHASACRNLGPEEQALQADEQALLDQICKAYYLPQWCSINDYQRLMEAKGLQDIRTADWSEEVAPFWGAVIRSALSLEGFKGLFTAGLKTIKVSPSGRVSIIACHAGLQQCGS